MALTAHPVSPPDSLSRRSLASELRLLWAVVRREWLIFVRYPSWVVAMLIWPVLFPAAYIFSGRALAGPDGSGLALFTQVAGTDDFLGYIVVGTTVWMWQNMVLWDVGYSLRNEQMRGTLETNWLAPAWRFWFLLGSSATQLVTVLIFILISAVEYALFLDVRFADSPWPALLVLLAAIPSIYGVGFAFASLVITAKEANAFVFLVRGLVMIFCGITFPIALLPEWMKGVARWLPQTYIIRAFRQAVLTGGGIEPILPDLLALLGFGAAWLALGYLLFTWMERRARQTGAIGQY